MPIKNVDAKTLKNWIDSNEVTLVDVREPAEHASSKIDGSALVPLGSVALSSIPDYGGRKLVIHCLSGKRSMSACAKILAENPDAEVYNLDGGISAWSAAGYQTIKSDRFFLPLDRQVHLTIGIMLVVASLLGYYLSQWWFVMTGLIGAGLTVAGATGFCGLALIMAKMPWNQKPGSAPTCYIK